MTTGFMNRAVSERCDAGAEGGSCLGEVGLFWHMSAEPKCPAAVRVPTLRASTPPRSNRPTPVTDAVPRWPSSLPEMELSTSAAAIFATHRPLVIDAPGVSRTSYGAGRAGFLAGNRLDPAAIGGDRGGSSLMGAGFGAAPAVMGLRAGMLTPPALRTIRWQNPP